MVRLFIANLHASTLLSQNAYYASSRCSLGAVHKFHTHCLFNASSHACIDKVEKRPRNALRNLSWTPSFIHDLCAFLLSSHTAPCFTMSCTSVFRTSNNVRILLSPHVCHVIQTKMCVCLCQCRVLCTSRWLVGDASASDALSWVTKQRESKISIDKRKEDRRVKALEVRACAHAVVIMRTFGSKPVHIL